MTRFYYFDTYGEKLGPIDSQQLKGLVAQGVVRPDTQLETENGQRGQARQISGLFPKQVSAASVAALAPKDDMDEDEIARRIKSDENAAKIILTMLWILGTVALFLALTGQITHKTTKNMPFPKNRLHRIAFAGRLRGRQGLCASKI